MVSADVLRREQEELRRQERNKRLEGRGVKTLRAPVRCLFPALGCLCCCLGGVGVLRGSVLGELHPRMPMDSLGRVTDPPRNNICKG